MLKLITITVKKIKANATNSSVQIVRICVTNEAVKSAFQAELEAESL